MQGEVTVPYTPISGENMRGRSVYSNPSISGSTYPGGATEFINVTWTFPGGINSKSGLWGYLLQSGKEGGKIIYDKDLEEYLQTQNVSEDQYIEVINDLVRAYVKRVLMYHPADEEYDKYGWYAFMDTFPGCYH